MGRIPNARNGYSANLQRAGGSNVNRGGLVIGLIIAAVGLLVAVHRALVKIDALPVRQQPRTGQGSPPSTSGYTY